jgi:hypothetical protein
MIRFGKTMHYQPLNGRQLIESGAVRVVRHPDDKSNDPNLYSLVTHWNDSHPDSVTREWPNKPESYAAAERDLANPDSGLLYDGKYRQILWSADKVRDHNSQSSSPVDHDPFSSAPAPSSRAQEKFNKIADAVAAGAKNAIETPGRAMREGITTDQAVDWAAPTALGMIGMGPIGAERGAVGAAGGRLGSGALPMDEASRMARAREMGFVVDEPLYHGGGKSFSEFDVKKAGSVAGSRGQQGVFFSPSPQVASHYADLGGIRDVKAGETPHGVHDIPYGLADRPGETFYEHKSYVYDGSQVYPAVVNPGKQKVVEIPYYNTAEVDAAVKQARQQGYDTLRIKGMADTGGGAAGSRADQIVVLNPANIRSKFAVFDPANKDSGFILGSASGGAALGAASLPDQDKQ